MPVIIEIKNMHRLMSHGPCARTTRRNDECTCTRAHTRACVCVCGPNGVTMAESVGMVLISRCCGDASHCVRQRYQFVQLIASHRLLIQINSVSVGLQYGSSIGPCITGSAHRRGANIATASVNDVDCKDPWELGMVRDQTLFNVEADCRNR